jgi:hypothetical protein
MAELLSVPVRGGRAHSAWDSDGAMTSCRDRRIEIRYVLNITVPFPEDDNLFIQELIAVLPLLTLGMISSNPPSKPRCVGEMHSSRDSGGLPDVHLQYMALGANP